MSSPRWYTPVLLRRTESLDSEIVYDSEPGREEIRKNVHREKKPKKKSPAPQAVIEISSDSERDNPLAPNPASPDDHTLIEISGVLF